MRLGSYRDGDLTIGEFLSVVLHKAGPGTRHLADTALVAAKVRSLLTAQMLLKESYALGLDRDSTLVASVENERENLLVSLLRKINVDAYVRVERRRSPRLLRQKPRKISLSRSHYSRRGAFVQRRGSSASKRAIARGSRCRAIDRKIRHRAGSMGKRGDLSASTPTSDFTTPHVYESPLKIWK